MARTSEAFRPSRAAGQGGSVLAFCSLALGLPAGAFAQSTTAPPAPGFSIGLSLGSGWNSNPAELSTRERPDAHLSPQITLGYRHPLWEGAALSLSGQSGADFYLRDSRENTTRGSLALSLSQTWRGWTGTLGLSQRKSMNGDLSRHDSASREIQLALARTVEFAPAWSLALSARVSRRFHEDGTEDQIRSGIGATLIHKRGPWTMRLGGGFSYTLEDKTPILPRINDRTVSARLSLAYEWTKDADMTFGLAFTRTYSSYPFDRSKAFSFGPQISRTWRF